MRLSVFFRLTFLIVTSLPGTSGEVKAVQRDPIDIDFRSAWRDPEKMKAFLSDKLKMDELSERYPGLIPAFWDYLGLNPKTAQQNRGLQDDLIYQQAMNLITSPLAMQMMPDQNLILFVLDQPWNEKRQPFDPVINAMAENTVLQKKIGPYIQTLMYLIDAQRSDVIKENLRRMLREQTLHPTDRITLLFASGSIPLMDSLLLRENSPYTPYRKDFARDLLSTVSYKPRAIAYKKFVSHLLSSLYDARLVDWSNGNNPNTKALLKFTEFENIVSEWKGLDSETAKEIVSFLKRRNVNSGNNYVEPEWSLEKIYKKIAKFHAARAHFLSYPILTTKLPSNVVSDTFKDLCRDASNPSSLTIFLDNQDLLDKISIDAIKEVLKKSLPVGSLSVLANHPAFTKRLSKTRGQRLQRRWRQLIRMLDTSSQITGIDGSKLIAEITYNYKKTASENWNTQKFAIHV